MTNGQSGTIPARTILVTGGGGFLGAAIVRQLVQRGDTVRSLSRNTYPELAELDVEQVQGNISNAKTVMTACRGVDAVIHAAAKAGVWGKYADYHGPNVQGTKNVVAACAEIGIPALVHTSSPSVIFDGNDMEGIDESHPYPAVFHTHYTKTKAMAEQYVKAAAYSGRIKAVILRPHLIWGPGDPHLVPRVIERAKKLARVGKTDKLVDTIYIDDAASAHVLAADRLAENPSLSGNIYFISQGEPVYMIDMLNGILAAAGLPPTTRTLPAGFVWLAGAVLEGAYTALGIKKEPPMTRFVAKELATAHWFDIRAARRDLGFQPEHTIEEGLKKLEEWLKASGGT
ncbi:MAG: NAD-dependent epimerase/dehydratase family protein [Thermodesulfobacteriota bacterium]|nr:NAD-dependent epimerase/dehydratase family protein [Thermodesulfobacteriota bacterium]